MVTKDPRPPSERSRRDASSLGRVFFKSVIKNVAQHNSTENDDTKKDRPGLAAPFQELSNGGFGMSVAIWVCWSIDFLCGYS